MHAIRQKIKHLSGVGCPFAKEASKVSFLPLGKENVLTLSDLQTHISMFIMDHELLFAHH